MANFPNVSPTTRSYSTGFLPLTKHVSISGYETRIVTGSKIVQQTLQMEFSNLPTATGQLIVDHYVGQNGEADIFKLQLATVVGWEEMQQRLGETDWRYAAPVSTTQNVNGRMTVSVQLVSVV